MSGSKDELMIDLNLLIRVFSQLWTGSYISGLIMLERIFLTSKD